MDLSGVFERYIGQSAPQSFQEILNAIKDKDISLLRLNGNGLKGPATQVLANFLESANSLRGLYLNNCSIDPVIYINTE